MDETEELLPLMGRAAVVQMGHAPGFELRMTRNCFLALTGEPLADFNTMSLGPDADAEGFLEHAVARVRERKLPLLAVMSPHVAQSLAPAARRLGFSAGGTAPLMVLRAETPVRPSGQLRIERALRPDAVAAAGDLIAAAFEAPRDAVERGIDAGITETGGVEAYVGWSRDEPVSTLSVTPFGTTAGIWSMATPPDRQRQGFGRALLSQVIDAYRRRGVNRFFLTATDAGRPLYDSLGFETIAELSAWVLEVL